MSATVPDTAHPRVQREWALFEDWCAATGRDPLPTTAEDLDAFFTAVRAAPGTRRHRLRAVRLVNAANRYHHLATTPAQVQTALRRGDGWLPLDDAIAAAPLHTWPSGLRGRRDAWLLVLVGYLGFSRNAVRGLVSNDIQAPTAADPTRRLAVRGVTVPRHGQPATCPACVATRWLNTLAAAERGRHAAQVFIRRRPEDPTRHDCAAPPDPSWTGVTAFTPSIDRYGWVDGYTDMSTRAMTYVIAARQAPQALALDTPPQRDLEQQAREAIVAIIDAFETEAGREDLEPDAESAGDAEALQRRALLEDEEPDAEREERRRAYQEADLDALLAALDDATEMAAAALDTAQAAMGADIDEIRAWSSRGALGDDETQ